MSPITPHWKQPSHPDIQQVIVNDVDFTTKSFSRIALPPYALFARLEFPPCTEAPEATYATVQMGRNKHVNLNSDLLYTDHSCDPTLIFDIDNKVVIAGPKGLKPGDRLTYFYPATEWHMAQPFQCLCGAPTCRGTIDGAKNMTEAQLDGLWLSKHIRELRAEQRGDSSRALSSPTAAEPVTQALHNGVDNQSSGRDAHVDNSSFIHDKNELDRRGPTSRELGGEMGGDTEVRA